MQKISHVKLRLAMMNAGMGVKDLATAAGVVECLVSKLIKTDCNVRFPTLSKIAKVLGVQAAELF